jgi:hypothetical protein
VSVGTARDSSFAPIGSNLSDYDNYFCRDCRRIVHVRKGSAGFRACPTPGCTRPTGFGAYATTPRPRGVHATGRLTRPREGRRRLAAADSLALAAELDIVRLLFPGATPHASQHTQP